MSAFITARAGVLALVFAIVASGGATNAAVPALQDSLSRPATDSQPSGATEPFGLATSALGDSPLRAKWLEAERAIAAEAGIIAGCESDPSRCASRPALRFLDIVKAGAARQGLARLGEINRAVNLAIRPISDRAQYGVEDHWASPLATLASGAGDCEDYAIAKLVALRAAGVNAEDLRLVIIRETASGEDHAVIMARAEGHWRVLDNRTFMMIEDGDLAKYRPLFAIDAEGAKRFEQPALAQAADHMQVRPAEIATHDPVADASMSAIGPSAQAGAADDVVVNLAM